MSQTTATDPRPHWYQHRWPWVLMSIPFAAVLFGIFMVVTALRYPDDVVADTYYRDGQGINQLRALDEMAHTLGLSASLISSAEDGRSQLLLGGGEEAVLQLFLYHVTDSSADRRYLFSPRAQGVYEGIYESDDGTLPALLAQRGVWYLELRGEQDNWRLRKRVETPFTRLEF
ncbi:MAG: FixH family protein [Gammaproteobacteria bacterium]|nr:FixH family protein [Gammaproteobacteria bacterium]